MTAGDAESALSRDARPAWRLVVLVAAIVSGLIGLVAVDHRLAVAAAQEVVTPVDKRVTAVETLLQESREDRRSVSRKLDALCRAIPEAKCPLGDQ